MSAGSVGMEEEEGKVDRAAVLGLMDGTITGAADFRTTRIRSGISTGKTRLG